MKKGKLYYTRQFVCNDAKLFISPIWTILHSITLLLQAKVVNLILTRYPWPAVVRL